MKIVQAHNTYQQPGGEDISFRNEAALLRRAGHQVVEYVRSNDEISRYVSNRQLTLARRTIWCGHTRKDFYKLLLREKPDVVHVHNTFVTISPSIFWACRDAGMPVVLGVHNYRLLCPAANFLREGKICEECVEHGVWRAVRYGCYRGSRKTTAVASAMLTAHHILGTWSRLINCYIVPTEFGRSKFVAAGYAPEKLVVKPHFVYPDPGCGLGERSYVLYAGRLSPEKGLRTLLEAWSQLRAPIPLQIVGEGPMRAEMESYIAQRDIKAVSICGRLSHPEVLSRMQGARFLLFPSECFEAFGYGIIEAFACGTGVMASSHGAPGELVEDGRTGRHFTPGDSRDLAEKVTAAWEHPETTEFWGQQARFEYEAKYTAERNYTLIMEVYKRVISRSAAVSNLIPELSHNS